MYNAEVVVISSMAEIDSLVDNGSMEISPSLAHLAQKT